MLERRGALPGNSLRKYSKSRRLQIHLRRLELPPLIKGPALRLAVVCYNPFAMKAFVYFLLIILMLFVLHLSGYDLLSLGIEKDMRKINSDQPIEIGQEIYGGTVYLWVPQWRVRRWAKKNVSYVYEGTEENHVVVHYKFWERIRYLGEIFGEPYEEANVLKLPFIRGTTTDAILDTKEVHSLKAPAKKLLLRTNEQKQLLVTEISVTVGVRNERS